MVFDFLKVGRGEDTAAHYVVTCDFDALGRISDAAVALACHSDVFAEVQDGVDLARAVAVVVARGKDELQAES